MARMNWRILGVSIAMVVFNLEAAAAIGQEKIKFPVGIGTKTVGTNMFWLGVKKGFFDGGRLGCPAGPQPFKYIDPSYLQQVIKELG